MTVWADVSEWQTGVNDSYPYRMVCIRSNDGTYRDTKWDNNYVWCKRQADAGNLDCFLVYMVYRTNWQQTLDTFKSQVGSPHPKMVAMVDVESWGGQIGGNQSGGINALIDGLANFLGDRRRVIAYGNQGDLNSLWPSKPADTKLIIAGYSATKPNYPNQIGWQYTDGSGYGPSGWPQGCSPFGSCDMNYANYSTTDFAAVCGVSEEITMAAKDEIIGFITAYVGPIISDVKDLRQQLTGSRDLIKNADGTINLQKSFPGWKQLGQRADGSNMTVVDSLADARDRIIALEAKIAELGAK